MTNILRNTLILLFSLTLVSIDAFAATAKVEISKIYTHDYRYNPIKYVNNYDGSIVDVPADVQGVYACAKLTLTDDSFPSPGYYKIPTGIISAYIESIYSGYGMVYLAPRGYFGDFACRNRLQ